MLSTCATRTARRTRGTPWRCAVCAFEGLHTKDGWEYLLMNRRDIEDIDGVFERADTPEEFARELLQLKERDPTRRTSALIQNSR